MLIGLLSHHLKSPHRNHSKKTFGCPKAIKGLIFHWNINQEKIL